MMIRNKEELLNHLEQIGFYDSVSRCYVKYSFMSDDEEIVAFIQRCPRAKNYDGSYAARKGDVVDHYDYMIDFTNSNGLYRTKEGFDNVEDAIDTWIKEDEYPLEYVDMYTTWEVWEYR